jgi:hypothetical protein
MNERSHNLTIDSYLEKPDSVGRSKSTSKRKWSEQSELEDLSPDGAWAK